MTALAPSAGYTGPYAIINTTLNVVSGDELAWQERKGEAFAFTPRFCGFDAGQGRATHARTVGDARLSAGGYRPTGDYAYPNTADKSKYLTGSGVKIGTAMATSGAASSPNMGSGSSTSRAFLMTVPGVRLGWWLGNPRRADRWRRAGPKWGLIQLLKEMAALTDDTSKYVYLSDGGHFENLAIYELVRRRCRFIVVCDAEQDGEYKFGGLGNAIRKCRTDLGADIRIDLDEVKPAPGARSKSHCAIGKIVYARKGKGEPETGIPLYVKSSLTGDEPADLLQNSLRTPEFPQESTADQWFDETQFESYRALGYHVAGKALEALRKEQRPEAMSAFADAIWRVAPKTQAAG